MFNFPPGALISSDVSTEQGELKGPIFLFPKLPGPQSGYTFPLCLPQEQPHLPPVFIRADFTFLDLLLQQTKLVTDRT